MISEFKGDNYYLSNLYKCSIELDGYVYPSSENAFQAQKTDDLLLRQVFTSMSPNVARREGKNLTLRKDINWDENKLKIMYAVVKLKFVQNPELAQKLIATDDELLVEGNTWGDRFWGVCDDEGDNYLGKILMLVRKELRENNKYVPLTKID